MGFGTAIGIVIAIVAALAMVILEGGSPMAFLLLPPMVLIFGATLGVTMASTSIPAVIRIPKLYMVSFMGKEVDRVAMIQQIVTMAEKARRDSALALEADLPNIEDDFTRQAVNLIIDGIDPDVIKDILDLDIDSMASRHHENAAIFTHASGFAPTIGITGTVMGLVHVLENLSNPASLGPAIASAFIATLYGVGTANFVYLPVANRLKEMSGHEAEARTMIIEGVLAIQAGDSPSMIREKLKTFLSPAERAQLDGDREKA